MVREVFAAATFEGEPVTKAVDARVDFQWNTYVPLPEVPVTGAVIRWSGVIVPPTTGDYVLSVTGTGAFRLVVANLVVVDGRKSGSERTIGTVLPFTAGQARAVRLDYDQGKSGPMIRFGWKPPGGDDAIEHALAGARQADQVVLALGLTPELEGEAMRVNAEGFDGGDRTSILLPLPQRELLEKVSALGKPVTVVLTTGSALSFDTDKANAILCAWYYGQGGGQAVVEVLLGETNPAGRLPMTFYKSEVDLPPFDSYAMAGRTYRYFGGKPLYAFGHGLSYTRFEYEKITLSADQASAADTVMVNVQVKNTGGLAGDEVVQVYARVLNAPVPMSLQSLVGFRRVSLKTGETRTVSIPVKVASLRRWDDSKHHYTVDSGAFAPDRPPTTCR